MTELVFTESFFETVQQIESKRLQDRLEHLLELMQVVPTFGSSAARDSLRERFGERILVADLKPFLLVYEYDREADTAYVFGVVHQKTVT